MTQEQLLERLRSRCSRTEYSTGQAAAYARRWLDKGAESRNGIEGKEREMIVAEIVAQLVEERFVDDRRFAAAFVRDKLKFNGWGRQKIVYRLRALGVDEPIIRRAVEENYFSCGGSEGNGNGESEGQAVDVLEKLLRKKWDSLKKKNGSEYAMKGAAIRFAMSRGFDYEDIIKCLNNIV